MCRESWGPQKRQYRADAWTHFGLVWGKVWSREHDRRSDSERLEAETKDASKVELCSSFYSPETWHPGVREHKELT